MQYKSCLGISWGQRYKHICEHLVQPSGSYDGDTSSTFVTWKHAFLVRLGISDSAFFLLSPTPFSFALTVGKTKTLQ